MELPASLAAATRISRVQVRGVLVPLETPHASASGVITESPLALTEVHTDAGASDYVMPEVMKIGGVTGWMRAAALAHAKSVPVSTHLWPEVSAQLLCCAPTAHWLEYATWWNPILAEPLCIEKGVPVVEEEPGSGVQWNPAAVERFAI